MVVSPLLEHLSGYIAGRWADAGPRTFPVVNPATGERLADLPDMAAAAVKAAIDAAAGASPPLLADRQKTLAAINALLLENQRELGRIITLEQGKPWPEATAEVVYAADFFDFCARNIHVLEPTHLPEHARDAAWTVHHRPAGAVGLITPWNFPLAMLAKKLAPALAAGCPAVVKPADLTPLTTVALFHLLHTLNLPAGTVNLILAKDPAPVSAALFNHPAVRLISFTGSTEVGQRLIAQSAPGVKRLSLELGGNAPFLVLEDADVELAARHLVANKFRAAGQTCVCANRVLVYEKIVDDFTESLLPLVDQLKMGNGLDDGVDLGPLINRRGWEKVERHVTDALARGGRRLLGKAALPSPHDWGWFYPPTVIDNIRPGMLMFEEETFGPVIGLGTFKNDAEAVRLANSTSFGLAAYVLTADPQRAERMSKALRFGHVGLNTGTGPAPHAPFGGFKQSGFGREGGVEGILEFCETQTVAAGLGAV